MRNPFRKRPVTSRAIAYLKPVVPADELGPTIELPHVDTPVMREVNSELSVAYMIDRGGHFEYVQHRHLDADAIDADELHTIGLENLEHLAAKQMNVKPYENIFAVFLDGNFESSLILLDQLWVNTFRQFVSGQYAIDIPARDILAF